MLLYIYKRRSKTSSNYDTDSATSSFFYRLSAPFDWADYGEDTDLITLKRYRGFHASSLTPDAVNPVWNELLNTSAALSATTFS